MLSVCLKEVLVLPCLFITYISNSDVKEEKVNVYSLWKCYLEKCEYQVLLNLLFLLNDDLLKNSRGACMNRATLSFKSLG